MYHPNPSSRLGNVQQSILQGHPAWRSIGRSKYIFRLGKWLHCLLYWLGCIRVYWSYDIHRTGLLISKRFFNLRGWRKTFPSSRKSSPRAWNVLYILDIFPIMTTPHFAGPHQRPIRTFRDHAGHRRISSGAIRLTILGRRWRWPYSGRNLFQFPTV